MCSLLNQTKKLENEKDLERDQLIELETHFLILIKQSIYLAFNVFCQIIFRII